MTEQHTEQSDGDQEEFVSPDKVEEIWLNIRAEIERAEAKMKEDSPCIQAHNLVHGPRQANYGHPLDNFDRIRIGWSVIVGKPISKRQFLHMMAWLKISRDLNKEIDDNPRDICGYYEAGALAEAEGKKRHSEAVDVLLDVDF